ncbi:MAG: ATP-dependent zinc metalloprotease FtsH [Clostridia bacterium]|nr:ATP-dependent zinc metalloprotease FtsH [Clostridia bacterium]
MGEILFYAVILVLIIVVISALSLGGEQEKVIHSDVMEYLEQNQVKEVTISNKNVLTLSVIQPDGSTKEVSYRLTGFDVNVILEQIEEARSREGSAIESVYYQPANQNSWWISLLPWLLILVAIVVLYVVSFKKLGGQAGKFNSFGKARVHVANSNEKSKVRFRDVAGADEEKEELAEIVEFLKDPAKFTKLGAKIPHGVLLMGPPGTGKTLLAKAVAGEAGVPFYSISGSDFVEMYVGVGASRVRDLFETARKSPASIIFIDEIDAVGRHRGAGLGGGHDEREQTLNQLLVEMDGFGSHDGIIVIAATNRPDILDPALLRPGRFDRQVTVNYPDMKGREEILKVHARNKPLESDVDFRKVAQTTIGFTGADLANLLNEAALLAAKKNKSLIGMEDIEESYMKSLLGPQKKTRVRTEKENKLTAYHEAGHAVVSHYCKNTDPVKYITIIPAGRAGGVTVSRPEEDTNYDTRGKMQDYICMCLGGRVAEALVMDDISTGASGDIRQATQMARGMVTRYGMSEELGTVLYGSEHSEVFLGRDYGSGKEYSEETAAAIDREVRRLIGEAYDAAKRILTEHMDKLTFVAEYLLTHESMDEEQFAAAMQEGATVEALEAIAADKAEKSRLANEKRAAEQAERERLEQERLEKERLEREQGYPVKDEAPADDEKEPSDDSADGENK